MRELSLFAGGGGGIMGGRLLGWRTACAVELDPDARDVLFTAQRRGDIDRFPIWDDLKTFTGPVLEPWRGNIDIVTGGFPCQDISTANVYAAGITGPKSGLWKEMARVIFELRPPNVLVENSPALLGRGLGTILGDLAGMGYDARWGCVCSADSGGPILRKRIWIRARPVGHGWQGRMPDGCRRYPAEALGAAALWMEKARAGGFGGLDAVARGMDVRRLRIIGNGQDPFALCDAWESLEF